MWQMKSESPIGVVIFAVIFVLILVNFAIWTYFGKYASVDRKRSLLLPFCVIQGVVSLGILALAGVPVILLPLFLAFIWRLHYRSIRFCESCSNCIMSHFPFGPAAYCPYCGEKIHK